MKIGNKNYKGLVDIRKSKNFLTNFKIKPIYEGNVLDSITPIINKGLDNVLYLTDPIIKAVDFGSKSTISKLISLRNEIQTTTKCYLYKSQEDHGKPCVYNTVFVNFDKQQNQTVFMIFGFMDFIKNQIPFFMTGFWDHDDDNHVKYSIANFSYVHGAINKDLENKFMVNTVELMVQIEVFLQYAEIDTKYLKHHQRDMDGVLCKYDNKSGGDITIVDSTWYTNLIKSDAFKVRGHFRMQPYGHGMQKKKLIWINEFEKEGYTREAKIISQHPATAGTL